MIITMKKLLTAIILIISLNVFAQPDTVRIAVTAQARDLDFVGEIVSHRIDTEDLFDSLKAKYRVQNYPQGTTNVTVTNIPVSQWLIAISVLSYNPIAIYASAVSRLETNLRAAGNAYLNSKLDEITATISSSINSAKNIGRYKLRRQ